MALGLAEIVECVSTLGYISTISQRCCVRRLGWWLGLGRPNIVTSAKCQRLSNVGFEQPNCNASQVSAATAVAQSTSTSNWKLCATGTKVQTFMVEIASYVENASQFASKGHSSSSRALYALGFNLSRLPNLIYVRLGPRFLHVALLPVTKFCRQPVAARKQTQNAKVVRSLQLVYQLRPTLSFCVNFRNKQTA